MFITICITTFKRDEGLAKLLRSISRLEKVPGVFLSGIVIDNDGTGNASSVVQKHNSEGEVRFSYVVEKQKGISFARNRAFHSIPADADYLAFIDDDEFLDPNWLVEYVRVIRDHSASVYLGYVEPVYPPGIPDWLQSPSFNRKKSKTGTFCKTANSGNVLIGREVIEKVRPWFKEEFAESGGEDSDFFYRVTERGFKIAAVPDAVAYEDVPIDRANLKWILKRNFRSSNTNAISYIQRKGFAKGYSMLLGYLAFRLLIAILTIPLLVVGFARRDIAIRILIYYSRMAGSCYGMMNFKYLEYR